MPKQIADITLADGSNVPFEEFAGWHLNKQQNALDPNCGFAGKKHTEQAKQRIGIKSAQKVYDAEYRKRLSQSGKNNTNAGRCLHTPRGVYPTIRAFAEVVAQERNITYMSARLHINTLRKNNPTEYYIVKE